MKPIRSLTFVSMIHLLLSICLSFASIQLLVLLLSFINNDELLHQSISQAHNRDTIHHVAAISESSTDARLPHHTSELLSRLSYHELINVDSMHLSTRHQMSILASSPSKASSINDPDLATANQPSNRPSTRQFDESMQLSFSSHGRRFNVSMIKNNFISSTYSITRQHYEKVELDDSGSTMQRRPELDEHASVDEFEHCYYKGWVRHRHESDDNSDEDNVDATSPGGRVALHTCSNGFSGVIVIPSSSNESTQPANTHYIIEPAHQHMSTESLEMHLMSLNNVDDSSNDDTEKSIHTLHIVYEYSAYNEPLLDTHHSCGVVKHDISIADVDARAHYEFAQQGKSRHTFHTQSYEPPSLTDFTTARSQSRSMSRSQMRATHHHFHTLADSMSCPYAAPVVLNADPSTKYVELLIVNDHARYTLLGSSTEQNSACLVNILDQLYISTAFSPPVQVILIGQITFLTADPYTVALGACAACAPNQAGVDALLSQFHEWRRQPVNTAPYDAMDAGHLFSGLAFETPTLGYAGVGAMCNPPTSGGIESLLSTSDLFNAVIAAHELGHNLGSLHDSVNNVCPQSGFIMNAVVTQGAAAPTQFSTCSQSSINTFDDDYTVTCMNNIPTTRYGNATCGNGFVEQGEACDCGSLQTGGTCAGTTNPCCDGVTCQFIAGATCSETSACCANCSIITSDAQTTCRAATTSCDLPELCSGTSEFCPSDLGYGAGTPCASDAGYGSGLCFDRICASSLRECRLVGASFSGGPYDACPAQGELNAQSSVDYCATLWCSNAQQQCSYFRTSSQITLVNDGVPCPDAQGEYKSQQCKSNVCTSSQSLNTRFTWSTSGWSFCTDCSEQQTQNVTCVDTQSNSANTTSTAATDERYCTPSSKPATSRLCINPDVGCVAATSSDTIDLFGYQVARKTILFVSLGAISILIVLTAICYHGATYLSKEDEKYYQLDGGPASGPRGEE